ncbi:hypothetical protein IFM89_020254 [Coptis chinensis]|uniref:Uncharacterized protein n=1 Tax=Coptis chinensis TaxID=261450 RepID=A0A835HNC2_9MAGN|nr:hypothetical protein IFM89_020254 [Coptis chinensis]
MVTELFLDFIVDTASGDHPFDPYMALLKTIGSKTLSGSVTGGTKDTREMLELCAANKIYPGIEVIPIDYINEALERIYG